ncbi:hypothetical protein EP073_13530 [Geovibrio thiophilus]|uniref:Restriction endonuclease type II EcoRII C-terminal domain-containing protein n=1 Tax=Geovibrio thiophilus TaxID=139438 RepID=A0A3R5XYJ7_9BACT|nr:hypothetical protein [Geovibrio thiophilus]QAR34385.1 hypothetical protein EP073_13530 [Geovibrio thiophilus]
MTIKNIDPSIVLENPWRNAYWFSRMLINNDKYGAIGKENRLLLNICETLKVILDDKIISDDDKMIICKSGIKDILQHRFSRQSSRTERINLFYEDLLGKIETVDDIKVFIITSEYFVVPINNALKDIPNNDREFTESVAKVYLDKLGEKALATVINIWDDAGVEGCLNAERTAVVREYRSLKNQIDFLPTFDADIVLTAFIQEFERRLGQKRKGRAGGSLEDVTEYLLRYFNIKAESKPEHFQADIEIDKWVKCSDKWLIGISCKRTLRERWKQVSSASAEILSKHKIKEIWHLITYDEDLSDDKLTLLGGLRHIFYLRDDSRKLKHALEHIGMKDYVRPMSNFINDIKREQGI